LTLIVVVVADIDVIALDEPHNVELPKGVAATFSFSVTVKNLGSSVAAATGKYTLQLAILFRVGARDPNVTMCLLYHMPFKFLL
jgi:hypothetical protein